MRVVLMIFCVLTILMVGAQDIEKLSELTDKEKLKEKATNSVKVTGGMSFKNVLYTSNGIEDRRDPYNYFFTGGITFSAFGLSVPFNFSYSNQEFNYRYTTPQPFNQIGLSPKYKNLTAHLGWRSMTFSSHTLGGHLFFGAGFDYKVKNAPITISGMYGRLRKAISISEEDSTITPMFARFGSGLKIAYSQKGTVIEVIGFRAWDDQASIDIIPGAYDLYPHENMAYALKFQRTFFKKLKFGGEFTRSGLTENQNAELVPESTGKTEPGERLFFLDRTIRTNYYDAMKADVSYDFNIFTLGVGYERVDPDYQSLGAYYFNNDLENYKLNSSTTLFKEKVSLSGNIGIQRNDLNNNKASRQQRLAGGINTRITLSTRLSVNMAYTSFQSVTVVQSAESAVTQHTLYGNLDSLDYLVLSKTANLGGNYLLTEDHNRKSSVNFRGSFQQSASQQGEEERDVNANILNIAGGYSYTSLRLGYNYRIGLNYNINGGNSRNLLGVTGSLGKAFFKEKLNCQMSANYNNAYQDGELEGGILMMRFNTGYRVKKAHNFSLSANYLNRSSLKSAQTNNNYNFQEFTVTLDYAYTFGVINWDSFKKKPKQPVVVSDEEADQE